MTRIRTARQLSLFALTLWMQLACSTSAEVATERTSSPYVLIIDGGSTGSRLHAFRYTTTSHSNSTSGNVSLERLTSTRVFQPLTEFVNASVSALTEHVLPLFTEELAAMIPASYHATTPVYYAATAGMRLVPPQLQASVYKRLEQGLVGHPDFPYRIGKLFTLSGDMEALYGVVACNYLQRHSSSSVTNDATTVAALDLGGASTQVALPRLSDPNGTTSRQQQWTTDSVYAVSHLAFGVDQFQQQLSDTEMFNGLCRNSQTTNATDCAEFLRPVLLSNRETLAIPHDFYHTNPRIEFWAMSLYFYTMDMIRHYTAPLLDAVWPTPTLQELRTATQAFCTLELDTLPLDHPFTNARALTDRCYQAVYMIELLAVMGFPDDGDAVLDVDAATDSSAHRQVRFLLDVNGSEVEWTLGMALAVQNEPRRNSDSDDKANRPNDAAAHDECTPVASSAVGENERQEGAPATCSVEGNNASQDNLTCSSPPSRTEASSNAVMVEDVAVAS